MGETVYLKSKFPLKNFLKKCLQFVLDSLASQFWLLSGIFLKKVIFLIKAYILPFGANISKNLHNISKLFDFCGGKNPDFI